MIESEAAEDMVFSPYSGSPSCFLLLGMIDRSDVQVTDLISDLMDRSNYNANNLGSALRLMMARRSAERGRLTERDI